MSIKIPIDDLTDEHKNTILTQLPFENPNTMKTITPFHVDEKMDMVYIPYSYAVEMGFKPPSRQDCRGVDFQFEGALRDYQKQVKKQVLKQLNRKGSCVLSLHVGWGKSMMGIYLATKLGFKTLIVVHKLILLKQWAELIQTVCPTSKYQIIKTKKALDPDCDFYLINAINIPKMGMYYFESISTLIVDELHCICAQTLYTAMFYITPKYLIGLSATPYRSDGLGILIDLYFGKDKIIERLNKKHTVYAVHTGFKIDYELQWDGKMDWNSVLNNQAEHPERNQLILDIIQKFPDRHFLVLCKRISHGQELVEKLVQLGEHVTDLLGTKKDFDENARVVVATTQKCGVGFSHDKLNALILAADMQEYFIQYLGRVFRTPDTEPIIFDIVDDLPVLKRHHQTRKKVYKESGGIINIVKSIKLIPN